MNGAQIVIDTSDLDRLQKKLDRIAGIGFHVLETIGAVVESQVRRRISDDQEAPDGTPWAAWSDAYAKKRHGGHSLLQSEGSLLDSIAPDYPFSDSVEIGSNLVYAGTHQFGNNDLGIPARPYLGLSGDDEQEITAVIEDWIEELLAA